MLNTLIILAIITAFVSTLLTYVIRCYALAKSLLDVPNHRSSHTVATPRGGGVAFIISFLVILPITYSLNLCADSLFIALWGAGMLLAVVGFMDDRQHIPARWRLLMHFIASFWVLYWLSGFPSLTVGFITFPAFLMTILAVFYLVWLINLYNFMDGINGIASLEAISACIGMAILYCFVNFSILSAPLLLLAAAVLGFVAWNFPKAKIFMGDAGSGFLGIVLGGLSIQAAWVSTDLFFAWLILLGVFIVDATWTLLRRLLRKEKVYEAHRSHTYQILSRYFNSHTSVTLGILCINICWLFPLAYLVVNGSLNGLLALGVAYLPLLALAYKCGAGMSEKL